jgi:hypothetical protein
MFPGEAKVLSAFFVIVIVAPIDRGAPQHLQFPRHRMHDSNYIDSGRRSLLRHACNPAVLKQPHRHIAGLRQPAIALNIPAARYRILGDSAAEVAIEVAASGDSINRIYVTLGTSNAPHWRPITNPVNTFTLCPLAETTGVIESGVFVGIGMAPYLLPLDVSKTRAPNYPAGRHGAFLTGMLPRVSHIFLA